MMPSCNTYRLTSVSLTLGVGYLFTAAPAKRSQCSLPWTRGISSLPPFLTFNVGLPRQTIQYHSNPRNTWDFQGKPFSITVIQVYAPTSNTEEAEVEWFYEDLQNLLELTPKKDVLFIIGDWNAKVGSQETPGISKANHSVSQ